MSRSISLALYAADPERSRGRRYAEEAPTYRNEFQRDRDRIIHSAAFRRLEYKTQVFINREGDMFRTRLTHSLEVAQIGRSIARTLDLHEDLTEAIALAHDVGHTPFGHAGQEALNDLMQAYGGFEHNLQSLRVVDELEERYGAFRGLNLTFEAREGILKHCALSKAQALGEVGARFINRQQPSLEAQLANLADEIAYNNHDVDDGLRAGFITVTQLREIPLFAEQYAAVLSRYPALAPRRVIHETIRRMINRQIVDLTTASQQRLLEAACNNIEAVRAQPAPLIAFSADMHQQNLHLKRFLRQHLYQHYQVRRMSAKAQLILRGLFRVFMDDPRVLPPEHAAVAKTLEEALGMSGRARAIADYIAGMTDRYAVKEYSRVLDPMSWE